MPGSLSFGSKTNLKILALTVDGPYGPFFLRLAYLFPRQAVLL
ncbi:hypothetical protein BCF11_4711 [Collimonas sp. PA-H2]|nr:hypothetical protein BCF11_4711 [Collimonas sp. PA-H2]